MQPFGRVLTAMITPFTDDGAVDHDRAWRLARFLVGNGSDGLVISGTTGESPTLSCDEKVALYRTVVEAVGERAHIVAGTGTYDTAESIHLSERAAAAGVDGIMAVTPYYSKPPQAGLLAHFRAIAEATDLPVILYNIPGRTGRLIEIPTLTALAEHPRIVAVKDAVEDAQFTARTVSEVGEAMAIYSGQDSITLPLMTVGAAGVVSVASHLAGPQVAAMVEAAATGDMAEALRLHLGLLPLFDALFVEPNPMPVKAAMAALWEPVGEPRLPLVPARPETVGLVKEALGKAQAL
ncbi:MAG TPA: 4-hydroxy-tetrahydrodipicolinate synthase [Acidimicrobiia bacterium]|jgi:4-hydroxy-tetrahydrodipicolinate synthase|nr:4-hydroxy-tetrahydrodipicolinate synthase [Acidimicrobiia bacterium]